MKNIKEIKEQLKGKYTELEVYKVNPNYWDSSFHTDNTESLGEDEYSEDMEVIGFEIGTKKNTQMLCLQILVSILMTYTKMTRIHEFYVWQ